MPAAAGGKKAAKAAPSPPGEHPVLGKQIARQFALDPSKPRAAKKWFEGIVEKRVENSKPPLWHVVYDDADSEDLEVGSLLLKYRATGGGAAGPGRTAACTPPFRPHPAACSTRWGCGQSACKQQLAPAPPRLPLPGAAQQPHWPGRVSGDRFCVQPLLRLRNFECCLCSSL